MLQMEKESTGWTGNDVLNVVGTVVLFGAVGWLIGSGIRAIVDTVGEIDIPQID
jgi:hypothetical protein